MDTLTYCPQAQDVYYEFVGQCRSLILQGCQCHALVASLLACWSVFVQVKFILSQTLAWSCFYGYELWHGLEF